MQIEYEATFPKINKEEIKTKLKLAGAKLIRKEYLQKRIVFHLPKGNEIKGGWLRVRDEGDKVTMSLKVVDGDQIHNQKEICIQVDSLEKGEAFLTGIGCEKKAYQENKRELWNLNDVEITIDEWPFLEPYLEVEGLSEEKVKETCLKLGLDYNTAIFCSTDTLYSQKYNLPNDRINNQTPRIAFGENNPFQ